MSGSNYNIYLYFSAAHEIVGTYRTCTKLLLNTRADVSSMGSVIYNHTLCMRAVKTLTSLFVCTVLSEPSLFTSATSTKSPANPGIK